MNLKSIFYLHRSDRKVLLLLLLFIVGSIGFIIFVGNQTTETSGSVEKKWGNFLN